MIKQVQGEINGVGVLFGLFVCEGKGKFLFGASKDVRRGFGRVVTLAGCEVRHLGFVR